MRCAEAALGGGPAASARGASGAGRAGRAADARVASAAKALVVAGALLASLALAGCGGTPTRPAAHPRDAAGARAAPDAPVPEDVLAAHAHAVELMRSGEDAAAAAELEAIVAAHPELPGPHVNLAILHRRAGRDDDARLALERALAIDPDHPEANNELGILLRERGEFEAAEAAYRRALAARPDYALALYNLGVLLDLYLQRPAEALECYEAYQRAAPEPDERVARWIVDLRRRVPEDASAARLARGNES
ncbi:MAG TPA: tetratricopeptide repeat protein [Gammaproteobacteria bacterium]